MKNTYLKTAVALLFAFCPLVSQADKIITAMSAETGTFEKYSNNKFTFKTDKGATLELAKATVRQLILDEPVSCSLTKSGNSKPEKAELAGYDKLKFTFLQNKKKIILSAMNIKSIKADPVYAEGSGGGTVDDGNAVIPAIDVSGFEGAEMTESQRKTLEMYKAVRKRYETFIIESSRMVKQMDTASGAKREELLSALRIRKNQEQPFRIEMSSAQKALLAAFPDPIPAAPQPAAPDPVMVEPTGGMKVDEAMDSVDDSADVEILLIDTSAIAAAPGLTDAQKDALVAYDGAVAEYQMISEKQAGMAATVNSAPQAEKPALMAEFEQGEKDASAARKAVIEAQKAFIKAFPMMRLTE